MYIYIFTSIYHIYLYVYIFMLFKLSSLTLRHCVCVCVGGQEGALLYVYFKLDLLPHQILAYAMVSVDSNKASKTSCSTWLTTRLQSRKLLEVWKQRSFTQHDASQPDSIQLGWGQSRAQWAKSLCGPVKTSQNISNGWFQFDASNKHSKELSMAFKESSEFWTLRADL